MVVKVINLTFISFNYDYSPPVYDGNNDEKKILITILKIIMITILKIIMLR